MNNFFTDDEIQTLSSQLSGVGLTQVKNENTQQLATELYSFCQSQLMEGKFKEAHIGTGVGKSRAEEIRRDKTLWIDEGLIDQCPRLDHLYGSLLALAKEQLLLPVKRYECHFSHYQEGDFYKKHKDRHKGSTHRVLTVLFYLNDLSKEQGGSLELELDSGNQVSIQPQCGNLVVFDSRFEHEVKTCHADRFAISGWLRDDERLY